jgi:hypothetical protein
MRSCEAAAGKDVNTESEEYTMWGDVARQQLAKTQEARKDLVHAVVNCRVYELATAL